MKIGQETTQRAHAIAMARRAHAYGAGGEQVKPFDGSRPRPAALSELSKVARRKFEFANMDMGATTAKAEAEATLVPGASETTGETETETKTETSAADTRRGEATTHGDDEELTPEQERVVADLRKRDKEVRDHERAHLAAAGSFARGGASYQMQRGPDGHAYAVGGEVSIDVSKVPDNPRATLQKAQVVQRAALAPAEPSAQDKRVASAAAKMANEARAELRDETRNDRSVEQDQQTPPDGPSEVDPGLTRLSSLESERETPQSTQKTTA